MPLSTHHDTRSRQYLSNADGNRMETSASISGGEISLRSAYGIGNTV
jgi:hypothetical protein